LVSYSISTVGLLGSAITYAKGLTRLQLQVTAETAFVRLLVVISTQWVGTPALYVGLPLANIFLFWRSLNVSCRIVEGKTTHILVPLLGPATCAIMTGFAGWFALHILPTSFLAMAAVFAGGSALYLLLLLLLDNKHFMKDLAEFRQLIRINVDFQTTITKPAREQ
jgi:hypothetical protein